MPVRAVAAGAETICLIELPPAVAVVIRCTSDSGASYTQATVALPHTHGSGADVVVEGVSSADRRNGLL
jgi:hypothetical protein